MGRGRRDRRRGSKISDEERLGALVGELAGDPGYAAGTKRFPRAVAAEDAVAVVTALAGELDEGTALRAQIAVDQGIAIACERGCNACCEELVVVDEPEAVAVARWLDGAEGAEARARFVAAYPEWRELVGDAPERVAELAADRTNVAAYDEAHRAQWRKRVLCAFNQGGDCTIYPVRPLVCRNAHAIETRDRCAGTSLIPASRLTLSPVDDLVGKGAFLVRALHNAMGAKVNRGEALCAAVKRLLGGGGHDPGS